MLKLIWLIVFVIMMFIVGVVVWTTIILRQQKASWQNFAKKNGLEYQARSFMQSAIVKGTIDGFPVALFSDAQKTDDVRGQRYVSVIEIETGSGMPTGAAIGTPEMRSFIDALSFMDTVAFEHEKWQNTFVAKTRDTPALKAFMTSGRINALMDVMTMNNVAVLFFFDELAGVLHLETIDPLRDPERLDRIIKRLVAAIGVLAPENRVISAQPAVPEPPVQQYQPPADTEQ